ncbi:cupin domain-containing protein [Halobellus rubicundus]|uniref:Cupin domain-containing protein n=1 Tax=Halobellus rubicundus TaxID=2996466 RepID=A0ABD5MD48_9EURY
MTRIEHLPDLDAAPHANVFPDREPKTVKLSLDAGERVPPHDHPDREIVLYLLEGALRLELGGETHALKAGDVARFDGDQQISPVADEPSTALLVLAKSAETR